MNSKKLINEIHNKLRELQRQPSTIYDQNKELRLKQLLEEAWIKEEEYWGQKSWVKWLKAWDRNTKFVHQETVERRRKNTIKRIQRFDDTWTYDVLAMRREYDVLVHSRRRDVREWWIISTACRQW